jgi:hypothetical protein
MKLWTKLYIAAVAASSLVGKNGAQAKPLNCTELDTILESGNPPVWPRTFSMSEYRVNHTRHCVGSDTVEADPNLTTVTSGICWDTGEQGGLQSFVATPVGRVNSSSAMALQPLEYPETWTQSSLIGLMGGNVSVSQSGDCCEVTATTDGPPVFSQLICPMPSWRLAWPGRVSQPYAMRALLAGENEIADNPPEPAPEFSLQGGYVPAPSPHEAQRDQETENIGIGLAVVVVFLVSGIGISVCAKKSSENKSRCCGGSGRTGVAEALHPGREQLPHGDPLRMYDGPHS